MCILTGLVSGEEGAAHPDGGPLPAAAAGGRGPPLPADFFLHDIPVYGILSLALPVTVGGSAPEGSAPVSYFGVRG